MRQLFKIAAVFFSCAVAFSCAERSDGKIAQEAQAISSDHVAVRYFHGNFRCANCVKIEKYTKEAVDLFYADEKKNGKLVYDIINVDEPANSHYPQKYGLYTKSVVVSLFKGGKEIKFKNLEKIWEFLGNENMFMDYIKTETDAFLKELN